MYLIENNNKQTENNEQIINDELNKNIIKEIKEENTIEELSSEKNRNEENFNENETKSAENKEETNVNEKNEDNIINKTDTKNINHEIVLECINNCINWTLKACVIKKNIPKDFKNNFNFPGKNLFFSKLEYSILNAMNNSSCFEKCFPKNYNFENKKKYYIN